MVYLPMHSKAGKQFVIECSHVVAAIHTSHGLKSALRLPPGAVDLLEIRLDALVQMEGGMRALVKTLPKLKIPLLITARDPKEGGIGSLTLAQRRELLQAALPFASLLDLELRNAAALKDVREAARAAGVGVVLSAHDFAKTPSLARLEAMKKKAATFKPAVFKFAGLAKTTEDLSVLLAFLTREKKLPLAVMGMGPWGKLSRLTLGAAGSVLNYGFLDEANATGQWPARLLKERLREVVVPKGF
ncbi:MAG: type I 3-dehydroquinate dehydratase [Chthoniobacteraceae bacterium]